MAARRRRQIAIQVPEDLPGRIQAAAAAHRRTATSLLLEWIEAGLAGAAGPAAAAALPVVDLESRLEALEAAVLALQRPGPGPVAAPPPPPAEAGLAPLQEGEPITTAELAQRTRTNRASWNNWANPDRIGTVRSHAKAGNWRLIGKVTPSTGGPPRWVWTLV